jgi:hypothetical protein
VAYNLVISNNTVTDATTLSSSVNTSGFETLFVDAADADQDYYIAIGYVKGSSNLTATVTFNGFGYAGESESLTYKSSDSGSVYFYGPFTKSGSTFGRTVPQLHLMRVGKKAF